MPIAKLPDVRRALVLPVFCRRLPRDAVILLWEYVEGPARFFYNVWPLGEEAFREWEPCMELISDFLGEEGWQSLAPTNRSVWILRTWIVDYVAQGFPMAMNMVFLGIRR